MTKTQRRAAFRLWLTNAVREVEFHRDARLAPVTESMATSTADMDWKVTQIRKARLPVNMEWHVYRCGTCEGYHFEQPIHIENWAYVAAPVESMFPLNIVFGERI